MELGIGHWVLACEDVGGEAGQKEAVKAEDEVEAHPAIFLPLVSNQSEAYRVSEESKVNSRFVERFIPEKVSSCMVCHEHHWVIAHHQLMVGCVWHNKTLLTFWC